MRIRNEHPGDADAIRAVNDAAFGQPIEGAIVDALRASCDQIVSLVALDGDAIVGHILFSAVELRAAGSDPSAVGASSASPYPLRGMGLAPMAVLPQFQRRGIGSLLVREGLARIRTDGVPFVVVLGHANFYPRFGFERASAHKIGCPWDVPDESFMLIELRKGALPAAGGIAFYRDEFNTAV